MGEFDDQINEIEDKINELKEKKLDLQMLDIERQNAATLHEKLCTQNHVDECKWFYEIKDGVVNWEGQVHKNWTEKARRLMHAGYRIPDILAIKDIMNFSLDK